MAQVPIIKPAQTDKQNTTKVQRYNNKTLKNTWKEKNNIKK